jgi:sortase A
VDEIIVERLLQRSVYQVVETEIVDPSDTHVLAPASRSMLPLITCYPFGFIGPAPQRYIVKAIGDLEPGLQSNL